MQKGISKRPEFAAPPARAQPAMEAPAEDEQRGEEEGVRVPGEELCSPRPVESARRPHRNQETLQPEAR